MEQCIQIRIGGLSSENWRDDLNSYVEDCDLTSNVRLLDRKTKEPGSSAAIDPQIVAAAITGGVSIIVALIPVIVDVFRKKSRISPTVVNVTLHGTANSHSVQVTENNLTQESLNEIIASIGDLTEIDIS